MIRETTGMLLKGVLGALLLVPCSAQAKGGELAPEKKAFKEALQSAMPTAGATDGNATGKLGTGRMRSANRVASQVLEKRMRKRRPNDLKLLRQAGAADVVVVLGSYDRVQDVLRAVKIKHVVVPPRLVHRIPLMSTQTLMINCPGHRQRAGGQAGL